MALVFSPQDDLEVVISSRRLKPEGARERCFDEAEGELGSVRK